MTSQDTHTEFFPGRSSNPDLTTCRGWELPYGTGLVIPLGLRSVEPEQDKYADHWQLWRDADGDIWMLRYYERPAEWHGIFMGQDLENAQEELAGYLSE